MKRLFASAAAVVAVVSLGLAPVASAAPATHAAPAAVVAVSNGDFVDGIQEVMPSLRDQYTDSQLVKIGKSMCSAFKAGNSVSALNKVARKYLTKDEAMVIISLSTAAFCPKYWSKVKKYYHIGG